MGDTREPERDPLDHADELDGDAALRWEGDEEFERITSLTDPMTRRRRAPDGVQDAHPVNDVDGGLEFPGEFIAPRSQANLLVTGVFGLLLLAEVIGWLLGLSNRVVASSGVFVIDFVRQLAEFVAVVGAAIWFAAVTQLTRYSRPRWRFGWLALGTLIFVPWNWLVWL